jgi:enamine deaminase RidA (YjgF/YER057c/UK114 family)
VRVPGVAGRLQSLGNKPLTRTNISSGYPFEETYGYSRAVRVGDHVFVSGTTARLPHLDGDAYQQMTGATETVVAALCEVGAELRHVVRTVIYVVDIADIPDVARAHRETFGAFRPASTLVQVAALTPASARIEIEVTAIVHD